MCLSKNCISRNMNKIAIIYLLAALASCTSKYKISGESSVSVLDGKILFLKALHEDKLVNIDSAEVIHGLFKMQGEIDSAEMVMLSIDDNGIMPIILENGKINIRIDNTELRANGTPLNEALYGFFDKKRQIDIRISELERKEAKMILNGEDPQAIQAKVEEESRRITDDMNRLIEEFITSNCDNVLGPGVFLLLCQSCPVMTPQMEDILSKLPENFCDKPYIKDYITTARENLRMMKEHDAGTMANR